jgi:hypothetical protein
MAIARIEELLSGEYVRDLPALPMAEVRSRRDACQEAAEELSYLRRLVQGRLDIVLAHVEAREGGRTVDLAHLVEQLPEILAEGTRTGGLGRLPTSFGPADSDGWIAAELDAVADAKRIGTLNDLSDDQVRSIATGLAELERKVSDQRRRLFDVADALQEEIVRRYKSGQASVDSLLR